jgi:hypothetical protein
MPVCSVGFDVSNRGRFDQRMGKGSGCIPRRGEHDVRTWATLGGVRDDGIGHKRTLGLGVGFDAGGPTAP